MLGIGKDDMDVSKNNGTPEIPILIGFSIINHPFWGTPIFGNTHILEWFVHLFVCFFTRKLKGYVHMYELFALEEVTLENSVRKESYKLIE